MKRKTFLRRLSAVLFILAMFCGTLMILTSCEPPPPPVPDCEKYGYGDATVKNFTGYRAKVDVTYTADGINNERWLNSGTSATYQMDEGKIYIWISFDGDDWVYDTYFLDACEDLEYTWYLNKKKSSSSNWWENYEVVFVDKDGEVVHRTDFTYYGKRNL